MKIIFIIFLCLIALFFGIAAIRDNITREYFVYVSYQWADGKSQSGYGWTTFTMKTTGYVSPKNIYENIVNTTLEWPDNKDKKLSILYYRYDKQ